MTHKRLLLFNFNFDLLVFVSYFLFPGNNGHLCWAPEVEHDLTQYVDHNTLLCFWTIPHALQNMFYIVMTKHFS